MGPLLHDLAECGLHGVTYVVSDEHCWLGESVSRYLNDAVHQRGQDCYQQHAMSHMSNDMMQREVLRALPDAWAAPTAEEAQRRFTTQNRPVRPWAAKVAN